MLIKSGLEIKISSTDSGRVVGGDVAMFASSNEKTSAIKARHSILLDVE